MFVRAMGYCKLVTLKRGTFSIKSSKRIDDEMLYLKKMKNSITVAGFDTNKKKIKEANKHRVFDLDVFNIFFLSAYGEMQPFHKTLKSAGKSPFHQRGNCSRTFSYNLLNSI